MTDEHVDGDSWPSTHGFGQFDEKPRDGGLRFSLAGVQLKLSAVKNAEGRLAVPASGIGGKWIVKLPSQAYRGLAENFAQVFDVYAERKCERASFQRIASIIAAESGHEDVAEFFRHLRPSFRSQATATCSSRIGP